ncbi:hypothetical protein DS884_14150 [Tenacibaculum sp. E3R01]|nr:hypothetical protein DS884_14150 [Tenacibaculum sp. E3R01]
MSILSYKIKKRCFIRRSNYKNDSENFIFVVEIDVKSTPFKKMRVLKTSRCYHMIHTLKK